MAIPFKIKMPKEGENSPEERIFIGESINSLVAAMEAVAEAFVDPETKTWIPPAAPNAEEIKFMRMAAFARLWSEVKYNFVFLDKRPNLDWDRLLELYLPRIAAVKSREEYVCILQEAIALLQDGHSRVSGGISKDTPLLNIEPVEGKPVVTAVGRLPEMRALPIRPGMELTAVNGVPVEQILKNEIYRFTFASTIQDRNVKAFRRLLQGESGSTLSATFKDMDGELYTVALECNLSSNRKAAPWTRQPYPFRYRELQDGLAYVALNTFGTKRVVSAFDAKFDDILERRALIIDIRNNTGGSTTHGYNIIARLIERACDKTSVWRTREYKPVFKAWGREQEWHEGDHGTIEPRGEVPYLKPLVVLIGPKTYSAAEDFLVPLKASGRATLIGEATGGSTGQPLTIDVLGTRVRICVKWDRYPDGTEFVGKGIQPDILVPITRDDIKENRDPVLEKAIEFLLARLGDMDH
jgi:C-terminal processing protease CtpA/Prc